MSEPIFQKTYRRVLVAILLSTLLLFVAISAYVSAEFKDELRSRTAHTAQLILSFAAILPPDSLKGNLAEPALIQNDELDYIVAVFHANRRVYASPSDLTLLRPDPSLAKFKHGANSYVLTHQSDTMRELHVVVGVANTEAFFSSIEIVLVTIAIFLTSTLVTLGLSRQAIRKGLIPITQLARAVSQRAPTRMTRLDAEDSPQELRPIVTATNRLLTRLKAALESEQSFAANAAHELRTPLAGILAQADAIDIANLPADARESLQHIQRSARRSSRQIEQLLDRAFAHSQGSDLPYQQFDLAELMRTLLVDAHSMASAAEVEIALDAPDSLPADLPVPLMEIILRNLVDNAIKYSATPGQVIVTLRQTDIGVEIEFEDNGPGLPEADYQAAISRFSRLEPDQGTPGHGLGLTIVHDLCQRLGYQIRRGRSEQLGGLSLVLLIT